jgi:hypothetical protein
MAAGAPHETTGTERTLGDRITGRLFGLVRDRPIPQRIDLAGMQHMLVGSRSYTSTVGGQRSSPFATPWAQVFATAPVELIVFERVELKLT